MATALIIVDVQNDFVPGGALPVPGGDEAIERINELAASDAFDVVFATRDWHPRDHGSFETEGGIWPPHCIAETPGAELHERLDASRIDAVIDKGHERESEGYSGFEGTELADLLRQEEVDAVTIVGLATDRCVRATALDAIAEGLTVVVDEQGTRGLSAQAVQRTLDELREAGAVVR